jgi:hypothetical protein
MTSSGFRPNNVGVQMTPETRVVLSTKSIIRQSALPVWSDCLIPRPICVLFSQTLCHTLMAHGPSEQTHFVNELGVQ